MAGVFIQNDGKITSAATPTTPKFTSKVFECLQSAADVVMLDSVNVDSCVACGLYAKRFLITLVSYGPFMVETDLITAEFSTLAKAINWQRKIKGVVSSMVYSAYIYYKTENGQRYRLCRLKLPADKG